MVGVDWQNELSDLRRDVELLRKRMNSLSQKVEPKPREWWAFIDTDD